MSNSGKQIPASRDKKNKYCRKNVLNEKKTL